MPKSLFAIDWQDYSINPIFQYVFDCLGFNPINSNFDFVFQGLNRLWIVSVTLILNGSPQKIVQRGQVTAPRRSIDIRISDDYSIFENGAQKIGCYIGCVASRPVLLKPNVVHVIFFSMMPPYQNLHQTVTRCGRIDFSMVTFGFYKPQARQFCLLTLFTFCPNNRKCTEKLGGSNGVL